MGLTNYEMETIVNFNREEDFAYVFTYEKSWQKHIEKRLGIKPFMDNGKGGKEYKVDKHLISKPRVPRIGRKLTPERKKQMSDILKRARESARIAKG